MAIREAVAMRWRVAMWRHSAFGIRWCGGNDSRDSMRMVGRQRLSRHWEQWCNAASDHPFECEYGTRRGLTMSTVRYRASVLLMWLTCLGFGGAGCNVDLDIGPLGDASRGGPDAYVALNDDDDNANGTPDKDEGHPPKVIGENDLVRLRLRAAGSTRGTVRLSAACTGSGTVRIWKSPTRAGDDSGNDGDLVALPAQWAPLRVPRTLYVEGTAVSSAAMDVELTLSWTGSGGDPAADSVRIAVLDVKLSECDPTWLPKGGDEANSTTFTCTIHPACLQGYIRFTLHEVSDYPGYCSNTGDQGDDEKDMQFPRQAGYVISGSQNCVAAKIAPANSATVTVASFDYGASGKIMAEARIGGVWFQADVARPLSPIEPATISTCPPRRMRRPTP